MAEWNELNEISLNKNPFSLNRENGFLLCDIIIRLYYQPVFCVRFGFAVISDSGIG